MPPQVKILSYTELLARKEKIKENGRIRAANYRAKAPQRAEIFEGGKQGETIKIGCWIGRSVKVPSL